MKIVLGMLAALTLGGCTEFMDGYNHAKYGTPLPEYAPTYYEPVEQPAHGTFTAVSTHGLDWPTYTTINY